MIRICRHIFQLNCCRQTILHGWHYLIEFNGDNDLDESNEDSFKGNRIIQILSAIIYFNFKSSSAAGCGNKMFSHFNSRNHWRQSYVAVKSTATLQL